jgi:hypothetical protein
MKTPILITTVLCLSSVSSADITIPSAPDSFILTPSEYESALQLSSNTVREEVLFQKYGATFVSADKFNADEMSQVSYAFYLLMARLGKKIEKKMLKIRDFYQPKVESVSMGDLVFNIRLSYGLDVSRKKFNATLTFDDIKTRRR